MVETIWLFYTISVGTIKPIDGSPAFATRERCQEALPLFERRYVSKIVCWPAPANGRTDPEQER
jgi:hypothetical protein